MSLVVKIEQQDEAATILRKHESEKGCELCGKFHPLSYGGEYFCQSNHHPAHIASVDNFAEWPEENRKAAKKWIIEDLERAHPGGFKTWCQERRLDEEEIRRSAE
jgi:hypothetical protein